MKGEFKKGMYAKIMDPNDPRFGEIGLVKSIDEDASPDHDILTLEWIDGSISQYKDSNDDPSKKYYDSNYVKIVLSRDYAIDMLYDIEENSFNELTDEEMSSKLKEIQSLTDKELLTEICLSGCVHDSLIDSVFDDVAFKRSDKIDTIIKETGKYRPKKKFLGFVTALKGGVRLLSNKATIEGKHLSGMLDGTNFEMTIYSDGTIDLIEVDTNVANPEMIQRLVNDISNHDVTGYAGKFILHGLTFKVVKEKSEKKTIKIADNTICYIEVEHQKPIDKLFSLMNEETDKKQIDNNPSDKALSLLDSLFGDVEDKVENVSTEKPIDPPKEESVTSNYLAESFKRMNDEKIIELKDRIERSAKEIHKTEFELKNSENKLKKLQEDIGVLNTRLETMSSPDDPNGWVFFISDEKKTGIDPDDNTKEIVKKISPILGIKSDKLLKFLTQGHFTIKVAKKDEIENKDFKLPAEILKKIFSLGSNKGISMISESEYEYRGDLNWHQLVSKMIRMGFEQSPEFEKISGSNSYEVTASNKDLDKKDEEVIISDNPTKLDNPPKLDIGNQFKTLASIKEPTDIVIVGFGEDIDSSANTIAEFKIYDDESNFSIQSNSRKFSVDSMGFGSIMTIDQYEKFHKDMSSDDIDNTDIVSGYVVLGFTGDIGIAGVTDNGQYISNIDLNDYICHQNGPSGEEIYDVVVSISDGFSFHKLNSDLSLPKSVIRDNKIDKINS